MPAKKPALGRGLDAIFSAQPGSGTLPRPEQSGLRQVPIDQIEPNPFQPRSNFDPEKLSDLAASIRQKGILQPVVLRRDGEGYQIVAGERRWRAAQQAGLQQA